MSSSVSGRPIRRPKRSISRSTTTPMQGMNSMGQLPWRSTSGNPSRTSWPRSARTSAVRRVAATHSGSTAVCPVGSSVRTPMRRRPGSAPTSAANGPGGDHAPKASPGRWPPTTSSSAAQSRTLRVIHPSCAMPDTLSESITWGPCETRPRVGFSPTTPHLAAGSRTEPPPSLPWATGTRPAATAAAAPPPWGRRSAAGAAAAAAGGAGARPRRGRRGGAAAGPAGGAGGVPRVAARAPARGLGGGDQRHLGGVGAPGQHEPGRAHRLDEVGVVVGAQPGLDDALDARGVDVALGRHDLLEEVRNAAEGPVGGGRRLRARLVGEGDDDGVELRVDLADAVEGLLDQLGGGDLAPANEFRLGGRVDECVRHEALPWPI